MIDKLIDTVLPVFIILVAGLCVAVVVVMAMTVLEHPCG